MNKLSFRKGLVLLTTALLLVGGLVVANTAFAATAPTLGVADTFGVLSSTFTPSLGMTAITGDLGYTTLSAGTFTVSGATHTDLSGNPAGAIYQQAGSAQNAALNGAGGLNTQACTSISGALNAVIINGNPAGTFPPGCYATTGAMDITLGTTVTLDATALGGTGNVWIFKSSGALTTGENSFVTLTNGATASNVFWAPIGLATLGAYTTTGVAPLVPTFVGNILDAAGITMGHFANLLGRALAFGGTVTTDANTISASAPVVPPTCDPLNSFDSFNLGSVNTQVGWSVTNPLFDQAVVNNIFGFPTFGCKSLRISNAVTSTTFGDQTFSPSNTNEAGETSAVSGGMSSGTRQNHFESQFDIASTSPTVQPGLALSVSPDRGDGSRMSYLRFEDQADGIHVHFVDVTDAGPLPTVATFNDSDIATLTRTAPHTIKFAMDFVDGPSNDIVKISIDGTLIKTGTSWEDYYRFDPEQTGGGNKVPTTDSLIFRAGGTAAPATSGNGFLFDILTQSSSISAHTITASADANGVISPSGSVAVAHGTDQLFTITPNSGFHVADVLVDGVSQGPITTFTFTNATAPHTISASFAANPSNNGGGTSGGGFLAPIGQVLGASTGPTLAVIPGCDNRTTGFSVATGQSCFGNIGNGGQVLGAASFHFTLMFKNGSKGNEVMELQKFLNAAGFGILATDGSFGPKTKAAVIKFQLANGLKGDGAVGPITRAMLNK